MLFRLLTLLWLSATVWFWWTRVPVTPTWSVRHLESVRTAVVTRQKELALVLYRPGWVERDGPMCRGPIEFWSLAERQKVREVFGNGDEIFTPQIPAHGVVIIRRDGAFYAASAFTGKLLCRLPDVRSKEPPLISSRGTQLLHGEYGAVRMYDLTTGREVWKLPHYGRELSFGPDFVVASVFSQRDGIYDHRIEILNRDSGAPDHRFDHLGPLGDVCAFEDSRYVMLKTVDGWTICDAHSGKKLWTLPNGDQFEGFRFEEQDTVLCSDAADAKRNVSVVHWRASDGTLLSPLPTGSSFFAQRQSGPEGRFAVDSVISSHPGVFPELQALLVRLSRWMPGINWRIPASGGLYYSYRVLDTKWGITYPLAANAEHPRLAHDGSGCTMVRPYGVDYYEFPPRRDWGWLVGWGFLPPATVYGLMRLWRWRRRKAIRKDKTAESVATVAPVVQGA